MDYSYIIRWQSDLHVVNTKESVLHVCDHPYHTNTRIQQKMGGDWILRNYAFGNSGKTLQTKTADLAKWCPYAIRIRWKWFTESFYSAAVYGHGYAETNTDDRNSPNVFQLVWFLSGCRYADPDTEAMNSGLRIR